MGLTGKLVLESEIKAPANEFFHNLKDHAAIFSTIIPHDSNKIEVLEGDGKTVGSVMSYSVVLEGVDKAMTHKGKVEAIDEENKSFTASLYDGDLEKLYKKFQINMQVTTMDGKNFVKCSMEY